MVDMSDLPPQPTPYSVPSKITALSILGLGVFSSAAIATEPTAKVHWSLSDGPELAAQHTSQSVFHPATGATERFEKATLPEFARPIPHQPGIAQNSPIRTVAADVDAPVASVKLRVPVGTMSSINQPVSLASLNQAPPSMSANLVTDAASMPNYRPVSESVGLGGEGDFDQRAMGLAGIEQLEPMASPLTDETLPSPDANPVEAPVSLNGDVDEFGDNSPWRFEIRPFVELPFRVQGDFGFDTEIDFDGNDGDNDDGDDSGGIDLSFDSGFELEDLFALGGEAEVWYNNFGVLLGGYYADLGSRVLVGVSAEDRAIATSVRLRTSYVRAQAALAWRIGRFALAPEPADSQPQDEVFPAVNVDLIGGAEYIDFDIEADFNNLPDVTLGPDWLAPAVRLRAEWLFNSRTKLITAGEIGGFGVGNSPDLLYKISVGLDWRIFPNFSIRPAYRLTDYNWQREGRFADSELDLRTQGLFLGLSYVFD
ncbi:outer membrane protein [Halomicronema sp. CCY15110]|uniref:outer membrane protein n=1 Tax=Halomicronema sp. CCY15110 TaxID=2767773 RepID=UPI001950ADF2|nr:hypothetical protein [Halomicronema sp. CCY15110]